MSLLELRWRYLGLNVGRADVLLPPVRLPRTHEQAYAVLYAKGPVIMTDLKARSGRDHITAFLQETPSRRVKSTAGLLVALSSAAGD